MPHKTKQQDLKLALAGHIGINHSYGVDGLVQEDSCGFAFLAGIMAKHLQLSITIADVSFMNDATLIEVTTNLGGKGSASFPEGFSPWEIELILQRTIGECPYAPQSLTQKTLGRVSSQGTHKSASALCEAIAKAVMNTFIVKFPEKFIYEVDDRPDSTGCFAGAIIEINGTNVPCLLTINASVNGTGPDEDTEGNIALGNKKIIMEKLGMAALPTIILESKQYLPALCDKLDQEYFVVRWNKDYDNNKLAEHVLSAAQKLAIPTLSINAAYPRHSNYMDTFGKKIADQIIELGTEFASTREAYKKVRIANTLAELVKVDMGSAIYMSNDLHEKVGSGGLDNGVAMVFSMLVSKSYIKEWKQPVVTQEDLDNAIKIIEEVIALMPSEPN